MFKRKKKKKGGFGMKISVGAGLKNELTELHGMLENEISDDSLEIDKMDLDEIVIPDQDIDTDVSKKDLEQERMEFEEVLDQGSCEEEESIDSRSRDFPKHQYLHYKRVSETKSLDEFEGKMKKSQLEKSIEIFLVVVLGIFLILILSLIFVKILNPTDPSIPNGLPYCDSESEKPNTNDVILDEAIIMDEVEQMDDEYEIPETEVLCEECPENGYCINKRLISCSEPFYIRHEAICIKTNDEIGNWGLEMSRKLIHHIHTRRGKFMCGELGYDEKSIGYFTFSYLDLYEWSFHHQEEEEELMDKKKFDIHFTQMWDEIITKYQNHFQILIVEKQLQQEGSYHNGKINNQNIIIFPLSYSIPSRSCHFRLLARSPIFIIFSMIVVLTLSGIYILIARKRFRSQVRLVCGETRKIVRVLNNKSQDDFKQKTNIETDFDDTDTDDDDDDDDDEKIRRKKIVWVKRVKNEVKNSLKLSPVVVESIWPLVEEFIECDENIITFEKLWIHKKQD